MSNEEIVMLYKNGHSIDYIVDLYYKYKKKNNKIINAMNRKIIIVNEKITKENCRGIIYKAIYGYIKKAI